MERESDELIAARDKLQEEERSARALCAFAEAKVSRLESDKSELQSQVR